MAACCAGLIVPALTSGEAPDQGAICQRLLKRCLRCVAIVRYYYDC